MRNNTNDMTLARNYLRKYRFLIKEYELVKSKEHPGYRFVMDFYKAHDVDRRTFRKYYNRYKASGEEQDLIPAKRGPKWKTRRIPEHIEQEIVKLRQLKGLNRYEIVNALSPRLKENTPSPSGVYNVLKRNGLNRLEVKMKEEKRRIIKEKAGELGHIDSHYLPKGVVRGTNTRYYLVCVIDSCTRVCWAELVQDLKSLTVMFAVLKCFNYLQIEYGIRFAEILTDNGPEYGKKDSGKKMAHPFERLLHEMGIKHRYIKPYRPQTNGKVERFWRTIGTDLMEDTDFDSEEELKDELMQYLIYYNNQRPHQALGGKSPAEFNKNCPRII